MGIGVQGEACGEVTQHAGYRLDVHAVLERNGCEGVAEVVEEDITKSSSADWHLAFFCLRNLRPGDVSVEIEVYCGGASEVQLEEE